VRGVTSGGSRRNLVALFASLGAGWSCASFSGHDEPASASDAGVDATMADASPTDGGASIDGGAAGGNVVFEEHFDSDCSDWSPKSGDSLKYAAGGKATPGSCVLCIGGTYGYATKRSPTGGGTYKLEAQLRAEGPAAIGKMANIGLQFLTINNTQVDSRTNGITLSDGFTYASIELATDPKGGATTVSSSVELGGAPGDCVAFDDVRLEKR
jgi:hypothetical protein